MSTAIVTDRLGPTNVNEEARKTLEGLMSSMAIAPAGGVVLFPNGIELIYIKVALQITSEATISAELKIAGPKAATLNTGPASAEGTLQAPAPAPSV